GGREDEDEESGDGTELHDDLRWRAAVPDPTRPGMASMPCVGRPCESLRPGPRTMGAMSEVTTLLRRLGDGDRAAFHELVPLVYAELRRIADAHMARQANDHTLQPTALVNEAFLKLAGSGAA